MAGLRRTRTVIALTLGLVATAFCTAAAASAHVTVAAPGVTAGASDAAITIRVPDESEAASTVGLKVQLPLDHPIAGVLVAPITGWSAKIVNTKLSTPIKTDDGDITEVVSEVDWTLTDPAAAIKPGYFGVFTIIGGKLPDGVSSLTFKAIQTYSDKSVVSWIEQAAPGSSAAPEHPAPVLTLTGAAPTSSAPASTSSAPATSSASPDSSASSSSASSSSASSSSDGKATAGLLLGILGVLLGAAALVLVLRRGRAAGTPS